MKKQKVWAVIADGAAGRIFRVDDGNALVPLDNLSVAGNLKPNRDVLADRPGRVFDSGGDGRHGMEPSSDPKRHAKAMLAREIVRVLDRERKKETYDRLIVVAPPQFLGDLRAAMPPALQALVAAEINKDLSTLAPHQLSAQLSAVLNVRMPL